MDEDFDSIAGILRNEFFYYFNIQLEPGYYEGFSLKIEFNFGYCLDGWEDRKEAQKEITRIKHFLLTCINDFGLCAVSPGWCTKYYNYAETIEKLNVAIKEMRDTVNSAPTWAQVSRAEYAV